MNKIIDIKDLFCCGNCLYGNSLNCTLAKSEMIPEGVCSYWTFDGLDTTDRENELIAVDRMRD